MLTALMILLAWLIVRNDFEAASTMVMSFGVLCLVQFFFELVPLTVNVARGRVSVVVEQGDTFASDGMEQTTFTHTVKTTPFFDEAQGFQYNCHSLAMLLSPFTMLM